MISGALFAHETHINPVVYVIQVELLHYESGEPYLAARQRFHAHEIP
jgi:hypothetical protein